MTEMQTVSSGVKTAIHCTGLIEMLLKLGVTRDLRNKATIA
jgi:hypothetical protein